MQTRRVRFRIVLPIVAVTLAVALMSISREQRQRLRGYDAPPPTTAYALGFAFNGPAFMHVPYLGKLIPATVQRALDWQTERLLLVALFWFLIGRAVDRKRDGADLSIDAAKSAVAIFSIAFIFSGWFFVMALDRLPSDIYYCGLNCYFPGELIISSSLTLWCAFLLVFFGGKIVRAIKHLRV